MRKQDVRLEALLTVISPQQRVRIMDETMTPTGMFLNPDEITRFKGIAVQALKEYEGTNAMIKHIAPEIKKDPQSQNYEMQIYIYS